MSNLFWLTQAQMARLQPFGGRQSTGLSSDPPHSPRAMASLVLMIGACSAA